MRDENKQKTKQNKNLIFNPNANYKIIGLQVKTLLSCIAEVLYVYLVFNKEGLIILGYI